MNFISVATLFLFVCIIFVNAEETSGKIKCFVCNENEDNNCADDYRKPESHLKDCQDGENYCRKVIQFVEGRKTIIRQCAKTLHKNIENGCYKSAGKATQHVCTCKPKDGKACNDAQIVRSSSFAMSVGLFALVGAFFY